MKKGANEMINLERARVAAKEIFEVFPVLQNDFMRRYETQADNALTPLQTHALRVMNEHDKLAMNELAQHMHMSKQQLTRFVDGLVRRGLFERVYDERNRRSIFIRLTEEGQKELEIYGEEGVEFFSRQLRELDDEEIEQLIVSLQSLNEILSKFK